MGCSNSFCVAPQPRQRPLRAGRHPGVADQPDRRCAGFWHGRRRRARTTAWHARSKRDAVRRCLLARSPRSIYEDARDVARALAKTEAFEQSRRERKRVEMLFAHLKRILRLGRLRLRGPRGAQFEFTLAAIAQNLRRLARLVARSPPIVPIPCVA